VFIEHRTSNTARREPETAGGDHTQKKWFLLKRVVETKRRIDQGTGKGAGKGKRKKKRQFSHREAGRAGVYSQAGKVVENLETRKRHRKFF